MAARGGHGSAAAGSTRLRASVPGGSAALPGRQAPAPHPAGPAPPALPLPPPPRPAPLPDPLSVGPGVGVGRSREPSRATLDPRSSCGSPRAQMCWRTLCERPAARVRLARGRRVGTLKSGWKSQGCRREEEGPRGLEWEGAFGVSSVSSLPRI